MQIDVSFHQTSHILVLFKFSDFTFNSISVESLFLSEDCFQQGILLFLATHDERLVHRSFFERHFFDYFKVEPLINQVLLSIVNKFNLFCIKWNQCIKVSVERLDIWEGLFLCRFFWSEDSTQTLCLLPLGAFVRGNLNDYICIWNVDWRVSNAWEYNCIDLIAVSEVRNDAESFSITNFSTNVRNAKLMRILPDCEDMITEYDNLVTSFFV